MLRFKCAADASVLLILLWLSLFAFLPSASAQGPDFTLTISSFHPFATDPGEKAWATLTLSPVNGFTGSVDLSCAVTPQLTNPPACNVSPTTATPPVSGPTVTIITSPLTTPATYTITVTATGSSITHQISPTLSVIGVSADYTLTVTTPVTPTSVHAGNSATGIVTITPLNGYSGNVTLSCSQITPVVTLPPVCTFTPTPTPITGAATTATLTINTIGPTTTTTASLFRRLLLALGMPLLAMTILGAGLGGKRSRQWLALSSLALIGVLVFVPACANSSNNTTNPGGNTPNNTYTITLTGADDNGVVPSNTSQTVSLQVN